MSPVPMTPDELTRSKVAAEHVVSKSLTDPSRRLAMGLPLYSCSCGEWDSEDANFGRHLEEQMNFARPTDPVVQDGSALHRDALAVALHGAQITHGWGCGPDSTGCRQRHRMDADAILALLPAAALPPSTPPALDQERLALAEARVDGLNGWNWERAMLVAAEYARLEQDR